MNRYAKLFYLLLIPLLAFGVHKHYISLTKIDYVKEKKSIQVTMRFFIDDIEKVVENRFDTSLEMDTNNENNKTNAYVEAYIQEKFKITINDKEQTYSYLGKEYENDVVYFYLEIKNIEDFTMIEVQNKMLFEEFEEQQNFIKLNIGDIKKTFILVRANDKEMLKL